MDKKQRIQLSIAICLTIAIIVIDQIIKIEVKTGMALHESIHITDWFYLVFVENNGMAWGMSIMPKIVLSLFRFVAIFVIAWYIFKKVRTGARTIYIVLLSMVLAGAAGNLIDCMFYGLMFSGASTDYVSYFVPFGTGYAPLFEGKVVDMFYFPLIVSQYPDWFPLWAGEPFIFFSPVFNFADASISVSVISLLLFCRKELQAISFSNDNDNVNDNVNDDDNDNDNDNDDVNDNGKRSVRSSSAASLNNENERS